MATNFDHKILIGAGRPEQAQSLTRKPTYAQVAEQMAVVGLAVCADAQRQINPNLMTWPGNWRTRNAAVRPYLTAVLQEALLAPAPDHRWRVPGCRPPTIATAHCRRCTPPLGRKWSSCSMSQTTAPQRLHLRQRHKLVAAVAGVFCVTGFCTVRIL